MSVTTRIYQIHQLLKSKNPIPLKQMMVQLEVSESSIKRDLALLRDQLGAPLKYDREKNGYLYNSHGEEFELPGLWFNESELYALLAIDTMALRCQPSSAWVRSNRSIRSTSLWDDCVRDTGATLSPASFAIRMGMNSAFTTLYKSILEENFAIYFFLPSGALLAD